MQHQELSVLLQQGDFDALFRQMGWDNPEQRSPVNVAGSVLRPVPAADKRGVTAWRVDCPTGLPKRSEQHRVVRHLKRLSRDQLVVFVSPDCHLWLWPEQRPSGVGFRLVGHEYRVQAPTDALLQRLSQATFTIDEETDLTSSAVLTRVRRSFNADKVAKSFYREFQQHHKNFAMKVKGVPAGKNRRWYASVLLNRLMFIYFIQQKGFLDNNQNYLRSRLQMVREHYGTDQFYAFYKRFLLPLFHEGLGSPNPSYDNADIKSIIGTVPYVNGGIFEPHELETTYDIQINDDAFAALFDFFDAWRWHLDENPTGDPNEINPDILGFIFEQYINFTEAGQKDKGAYYTKPDVTGYMAASTILPAVAERFVAAGLDDPCILLSGSGGIYIHDSILHGVDQPLPEGWDAGSESASDELALAGERWCDVTHRRDRCSRLRGLLSDNAREWSIDDAITENLDMRELLSDYLIQLSTANECDTAFGVLRSLTVCDPTVGSGAFLFAALEVLDPLYEAVLGRAAELHDNHSDNEPADCLVEARRHPSERYWMLKTLCLNNLYGVDLMDEAPEIAKLRLFLKLAAQIDDVKLVEPLPDLDFNIKTGNLLVGIADRQDAETRLSAGQFDLGGEIEEIKAVAERVADAYDEFTEIQSGDLGKSDHASAKQTLTARLEAARGLADALLHKKREERATFESWRKSHRPFHWFVEFPSVWRNDGFDVVIGNPPYIQTSDVHGYAWRGYKSQPCPDLYAVCVERASSLLCENGRISMVVMHSLCFNKSYRPLREHLTDAFGSLWISSYSRASDSLFSGSAKVRNTIVVGARTGEREIYTTQCHRWFASTRPHLMTGIEYVSPPQILMEGPTGPSWPFATDSEVVAAFSTMKNRWKPLGSSLSAAGSQALGHKNTASSSLGAFEDELPTLDPLTERPIDTTSNSTIWLRFGTSREADLTLMALAGRWAYLWWLMYGDEYHVTKGTLASLPCGLSELVALASDDETHDRTIARCEELAQRLKARMPDHIEYNLRGSGANRFLVGRYILFPLRDITDEADRLLAQLWGVEDAYEVAGNLRDRMVFGNKG